MHYVIYVPCVVGVGGWSTLDLISFQHNLTKIIIRDIYWNNKIENENQGKIDPNVLDVRFNVIAITMPQI